MSRAGCADAYAGLELGRVYPIVLREADVLSRSASEVRGSVASDACVNAVAHRQAALEGVA